MTVTYSGIAAPQPPDWRPVNGSRGRRRRQVPIEYGVVHLWVSPEDGPERYLRQIRTPALPNSGRVFQSRHPDGRWLWEAVDGTQTVHEDKAKRYSGRNSFVYRSGTQPYTLVGGGSPMPWCYGPAYQCIAGVDGDFHFAADPDVHATNSNPPWNDSAISVCLPGRYQDDAGWTDATSSAELEALAKLMVYAKGRWGIPIRYINAAAIRRGERGWCGHVDVNDVYRQSDHGDPGRNFPWARVIARALQLEQGDSDMARIVTVYDDATWTQVSPEAFAMSGVTLEWIQSPEHYARLVALGAASPDPATGKPYGIWRSWLGNFLKPRVMSPSTVFTADEFLPEA